MGAGDIKCMLGHLLLILVFTVSGWLVITYFTIYISTALKLAVILL